MLYLDSLRGLACMVVVFAHFIYFMYPGIYQGRYRGEFSNYYSFLFETQFSILAAGFPAVSVFFILSGFVLSYRFMGADGMKWKIIEAIVKRPVRLAGVIIFTMLPVFNYILTKDFWCRRLWIDYDVYAKMFCNVFTGIFSSNAYLANPPLWTINTELWGSFLVFGLCFLIGPFNRSTRLAIMIIVMAYFMSTYYIAFVLGMLIADLHKNWNNEWFIKNKNFISWIILACIILLGKPIGDITFVKGIYGMSDAVLLFIFVMCNDKIKRILELKPLVFIGSISYSVYVLHWLVLGRYTSEINGYVAGTLWSNVFLSCVIPFAILTTIIIIAAWFVDKLVDKPCIQFSAWFARGLIKSLQDRMAVWGKALTIVFQKKKPIPIQEVNTLVPDNTES